MLAKLMQKMEQKKHAYFASLSIHLDLEAVLATREYINLI